MTKDALEDARRGDQILKGLREKQRRKTEHIGVDPPQREDAKEQATYGSSLKNLSCL